MANAKHPGKKLIIFGKVIFFLTLILMTSAGVMAGEVVFHDDELFFIGGLIGFAAGFIIGWLNSILLIAFGELVENSTIIREHITGMSAPAGGYLPEPDYDNPPEPPQRQPAPARRKKQQKPAAGSYMHDLQTVPAVPPVSSPASYAKDIDTAPALPQTPPPQQQMMCPICRNIVAADAAFCKHCGTRFG